MQPLGSLGDLGRRGAHRGLVLGVLALSRGETVNAGWLLFAAVASYGLLRHRVQVLLPVYSEPGLGG